MKKILKLNSIASLVNEVLGEDYSVVGEATDPQAILVRSFNMKEYALPESVLAVARAGAGVNNIPCEEYAKRGVVVFNTPGANANAVKELVLCSMLMAARNVKPAIGWVDDLEGINGVADLVEKGKSRFVGHEIIGKTLGIVGMGAIGRLLADSAIALGMSVVGYDPYLTEAARTALNPAVKVVDTLEELYPVSQFITLHVPLTPETKGFINNSTIAQMPDKVVILNMARGGLVNDEDIKLALQDRKVAAYATDFASEDILGVEGIIVLPHLGASTTEAEDNCASMAASQLKDYLENGNVKNSVNMPNISKARTAKYRVVAISTADVTKLYPSNADVVSASKNGFYYTIGDCENDFSIESADCLSVRKL